MLAKLGTSEIKQDTKSVKTSWKLGVGRKGAMLLGTDYLFSRFAWIQLRRKYTKTINFIMNEEEAYDLSFSNPSDAIVQHYRKTAKWLLLLDYLTAKNDQQPCVQGDGNGAIVLFSQSAGEQSDFGETVYTSLKTFPFPVIVMYTAAVSFCRMWRGFLQSDAKIFWAQLGLESGEAEQILRD